MTQRNEQNGGHGTDGEGSEGILDDKTREGQVDETDTTGIDDDEDSPGMVRPQTARDLEEARSEDLEG